MIAEYLNVGAAIETTKGIYIIVDNNYKCEHYYSLINLDNSRVEAMSNNINNFRERLGEIISQKALI